MKSIGIDYGSKRVGVAVSDADGRVAFARGVWANDAELLARVVHFVAEEGVGVIVVGESVDFSGEENVIAAAVREFAAALEAQTGVQVVFVDERLTSVQARTRPAEGRPRGEVSRVRTLGRADASAQKRVDAHAAALILQTYLDKQRARR